MEAGVSGVSIVDVVERAAEVLGRDIDGVPSHPHRMEKKPVKGRHLNQFPAIRRIV